MKFRLSFLDFAHSILQLTEVMRIFMLVFFSVSDILSILLKNHALPFASIWMDISDCFVVGHALHAYSSTAPKEHCRICFLTPSDK